MVGRDAPSSLSARTLRSQAEPLAAAGGEVAAFSIGAIVIGCAAHVGTANQGIALRARRADAPWEVLSNFAPSAITAGNSRARVGALAVEAAQLLGAVIVDGALIFEAHVVRIPCPADAARADCAMVSASADGFSAAWRERAAAGVNALLVQALAIVGAVGIMLTLSLHNCATKMLQYCRT